MYENHVNGNIGAPAGRNVYRKANVTMYWSPSEATCLNEV
jgi:hypothetical protein